MNRVFVYGTLKRGFHNHRLLGGAEYIGTDFIRGTLINFGLPGVIAGDKAVEGEIYEVDDATLARLDILEGHPNFYERKTTVTINASERVFYYELQRVPLGNISDRIVHSGKWV